MKAFGHWIRYTLDSAADSQPNSKLMHLRAEAMRTRPHTCHIHTIRDAHVLRTQSETAAPSVRAASGWGGATPWPA
eukprot:8726456-Pyramimonas_sp.AAC.1